MEEGSLHVAAAGLRADAADLDAFVEALAVKLEGALPGRVATARQGGLFSRSKRVRDVAAAGGEAPTTPSRTPGIPRRPAVTRGAGSPSSRSASSWTTGSPGSS